LFIYGNDIKKVVNITAIAINLFFIIFHKKNYIIYFKNINEKNLKIEILIIKKWKIENKNIINKNEYKCWIINILKKGINL
jgi:hypothetical protein